MLSVSVSVPDLVMASPATGLLRVVGFYRWFLILIAVLQYPLHLYMLIAIRESNRDTLGGDSEDSWGFGQIVALTLLGFTEEQQV